MIKLVLKICTILIAICIVVFTSNNVSYEQLESLDKIKVEIKGEVIKDDVYELETGSTINDLIKLCDLNKDADLSSINLNDVLYDNEVIVIPKKSEEVKISINTATIEELTTLPGIGKSTAEKIINYRENYGSFVSLEDIKLVKGIGTSKYENIKERICL